MAWWPGVIAPGQTVGDIIDVTDLFTTFARLGGATENIPTDRIIDGLDQTALFLKGDTFSQRDYVFIYTGNILAATVKGRYKRVWVGEKPGLSGPLSSTSTPTRVKKTVNWFRCCRPRECSTS
jgi:arylsulfatase